MQLTISKLTKKFGQKIAVNNVSFSAASGEVFCLIGPNGSGKTTIVKTVTGLLHPAAGSVQIGEFDIQAQPLEAKQLIGYIPDEPTAWSSITGEEFLRIVGALYNVSESDCNARIAELLPIFNLESIKSEYFEDYSRGNKQKFSILAALLHRPKLLVIDEPIVGLDPVSAEIAKKLFADFAKQGGIVLMVTHTLAVAEEIASRIGFIENGRMLAVGNLDELRAKAATGARASLETVYKALL